MRSHSTSTYTATSELVRAAGGNDYHQPIVCVASASPRDVQGSLLFPETT